MYKAGFFVLCLFLESSFASNNESIHAHHHNLEEVVVTGELESDLTEPTSDTSKLFSVPGAEGDPLQALFSLPGVLFADDSAAEPAVRGSAPEDNIFLVDSLPSGNIYHTFGFSIFNKNVISNFELLPAAYPAQYNDATGAVFDVTLRDPRKQAMAYTFEYSLIKTSAMIEGQISENQAFYLSYRRSLLDVYFSADDLNEENENDDDDEYEGIRIDKIPKMSDYQGKYVWNINPKSKFSFLVLGSSDDFAATFEEDSAEALIDPDIVGRLIFDSEFNSQALSWDYSFRNDGRLKVSLGHLSEIEEISLGTGQFLNLEDDTVILKSKYAFPALGKHMFNIGNEISQSDVSYGFDLKIQPCSNFEPECFPNNEDRIQDVNTLEIHAYAFYFEDHWQVLDSLSINLGVNLSNDDYLKEQLNELRASIVWNYAPQWSLKFAAGKYHRTPEGEQIIRGIGNPDILNFKANHYTLGLTHEGELSWDWRIELYYKGLYDLGLALSEDQPDAELNYSNDAKGEAYGMEFLVEKELTDKWYGWLALSLSRSERTDLRSNITSKFTGDTPTVLNGVLHYQINDHWNIGFRYTWRTGAAYTPIIGLVENPDYPDLHRPVYAEQLNSERLPNYQRLDMRTERVFSLWSKEASLIIEAINLLNHENISAYSYDPSVDDTPDNFKLKKNEGLKFYPSIGFKIIF